MATRTGRADAGRAQAGRARAVHVGASAACEVLIDADAVDAFARLSSDTNPLHMDDNAAAALSFPRRVAHGMLAMSAISRLIGTEMPGPGSLWVSHALEFPNPVLVGDRIRAEVIVEQISTAVRIAVLRAHVINLTTGATVLRGSARVRIAPGHPAGVEAQP